MIGITNSSGSATGSSVISVGISVVGGSVRPSSPNGTTIWVDTNDTITSYVFSSQEPSNPTSGMVWLIINDDKWLARDNTFDISSSPKVTLAVGAALQYSSNAWVNKHAELYKNSSWTNIITWCYNEGEKFPIFTGGFVFTVNSNGSYTDSSATDGYFYLYDNGSSNARFATAYSADQIDCSKYGTLHARVKPSRTNTGEIIIAATSDNTITTNLRTDSKTLNYNSYTVFDANTEIEVLTLLPSSLAYIAVQAAGGSRVYVYDIWLE